jgi:hypothetical protein
VGDVGGMRSRLTFAVSLLLGAPTTTAMVCPPAPACGQHLCPQGLQAPCEGDTRYDRRCNHDPTHRVCARIGDADTSFFKFTHQRNWCNTIGYYGGGQYGDKPRCPADKPTWCICKWATARWIAGEGCNDSVNVDCGATDICATEQGLFFSFADGSVDLSPARACVAKKCPVQWRSCAAANAGECHAWQVPAPDHQGASG